MTSILILIVLHYQSTSDHKYHASLCVHCIFMVLSDFNLQCAFNNIVHVYTCKQHLCCTYQTGLALFGALGFSLLSFWTAAYTLPSM